MILQEIATEMISQIESKMQAALNAPVKGFGLGIKTPGGEVVDAAVSQNGERKFIGISDNKGTFFYIRYTGQATTRKLQRAEKMGACNEQLISAPFRIVFIHHCSDPQKLLILLQNAIAGVDFSGHQWQYGQKKVEVHEKNFSFIPWDIFNQETDKPKTEFKSAVIQLIAIDFDIRTHTNYNFCNLEIC